MSLIQTESFKKGIAYSTLFNFGAKALSFANNILIAFYFGTQASTDLYFYTIGIILFIAYLITGFSSAVLIPESMKLRELFGVEQSQKFLNCFTYLFILLSGIITIALLCAPVYFFTLFSKFQPSVLEDYKHLLSLALLLLPLSCLNTFLMEVLSSYRYFTLPMFFSIFTSTFSMLGIVLFHNILGTGSILGGLLAANGFNLLFLLIILKNKLSWTLSFSFTHVNKNIVNNIVYSESGNISTALAGYIPLYIISGFSTGFVTALNYGKQVADLINILFATQIASVSSIKLNELYAKNEFKQFNETFIKTSQLVIFILLPISFVIALFSQEILIILFKRGAFSASSVLQSSIFLRYFTLSICLIGLDLVASRAILASQKIKYAFWYQISMNIIQIFALFALKPFFQERSIPLALLIKYVINFFTLNFLFLKTIPFLEYFRVNYYYFVILVINGGIALIIFYAIPLMHLNPMLTMITGSILYFTIYFSFSYIFKANNEFNEIILRAFQFLVTKKQGARQ